MATITRMLPNFIKNPLSKLIGLCLISLILYLLFGEMLKTILLIGVLIFAGMILYRLFHKKTSGVHGTARFSTEHELKKLGIIREPIKDRLEEGEIIIGEMNAGFFSRLVAGLRHIVLPARIAAMHFLAIGRTGAGKTLTILAPNIVRASFNESLFISDVKRHETKPRGELWELTSGYRKNAIYFAPMEPQCNVLKFNWIPLLIKSDGTADVVKAQLYARAVVENGKRNPEGDFWDKSGANLLAAIWLHVAVSNEPHPLAAFHILNGSDEEFLTNLLENSPCREAALLASQYFTADDRQKSGIVTTAQLAFSFMHASEIQEFTYTTEAIDFRSMREKSISIYYQMRDTHAKLLAPLSSLILTVLFEQLKETSGHTVKFLLDEFANFGRIPDFENQITLLRSRKMPVLACVQSLTSQIEGLYGKSGGETIVGNFVTKAAFAGLDYDVAKPISNEMGKFTVVQDLTSRRVGKIIEGTRSTQMHGRELMTPDEIKTLPKTSLLIFKCENNNPFLVERIDYDIEEKAREVNSKLQRQAIPAKFFTTLRLPVKPQSENPEKRKTMPKKPEMPRMPKLTPVEE